MICCLWRLTGCTESSGLPSGGNRFCDIFEEKIAAGIQKIKAEKPDAYQNFEKLLASDVDAVIIATSSARNPPARMWPAASA